MSLWLAGFDDKEPGSAAAPLVMKFPSLAEGDDVSSIVGFEVEQMILPRLCGPMFRASWRPATSRKRPIS